MSDTPTLTPAQETEIRRLKAYFPFRICFGVIEKDTGKFYARADLTRRQMNDAIRKGHAVYAMLGAST